MHIHASFQIHTEHNVEGKAAARRNRTAGVTAASRLILTAMQAIRQCAVSQEDICDIVDNEGELKKLAATSLECKYVCELLKSIDDIINTSTEPPIAHHVLNRTTTAADTSWN
jgi:hypothetical protein